MARHPLTDADADADPDPGSDAEAALGAELGAVRPDLTLPYTAALPGARAAVLSRLWRGLVHEPLPWVVRRDAAGGDGVTLHLADGRRLHGPAVDPYGTTAQVEEVWFDERSHRRPARLMTALAVPHSAAFAAELDHSVASLALSRANQAPPGTPLEDASARAGWEWEQAIVDGHPFHPNCRSRPGFSAVDQLAYGPEHRQVVRLGLAPVEDALVVGEWPKALRDGGRVLVPVHPWQAAHVLKCPLGEVIESHPLMSLRTLALADGGPHVKTALSARLTSSVRDISVYSIETSAIVSDFMAEVAARTDGLLHVTRTLGAVTAGSPDLAAVLRESPDTYADTAAGERVLPVAALATTELPRSPAWLADFTRLALTVSLRLLDLGVALEAHGQNLLVVLSPSGAPRRLVYRDLADIRVSPARLARHGIAAPAMSGRIITDDERTLRRKLFGALITGTLGATAGSTPVLREALATAVRDLPRTPDLGTLLEGPVPTKALTLMRLSPERPGDIWAEVPSPLR
ncbi:IucA/IucC family protein [Streptomyces sp. SP18BB07]|uniref:IucA/IucC family protein n=1 Tax=Streptomyces sp. SP18BB07 TaxID=3002522 RepID=UPI002E7AA7B2|nr:IucA/IucC family protein [Streptomyces sp. SP18BB07]MEE1762779.1 IucA/IucC family protein [Streptomyces sp. SP18BB07]